ncbi:Nucleotide-binding universal stress protein, UspA family [Colwellia chukchiensis]|uniref:Nucleotide-binding universal stress protein, UspA family n=1 Tax=Colwellia chukchiensis TaxID=641665 RepID=A0A1H7MST6_9GAMM|nr:universal stress protein [Colwellia chukchiensis]SEL14322.1 Nucleotide-binding universal stress protein, UspA family [Colwellia chukchiensis]
MSKPLYLVAIDGSECSLRAVEHAMDMAVKSQANVKILTVKDWSYLQPMVIRGVAPPILDQATEEKNTIAQLLTPLAEKYANLNLDISTELLWGDPVLVIMQEINKLSVDMLFVGRQGRSSIVDILLGSVANKLAHRVDIPIVLVP